MNNMNYKHFKHLPHHSQASDNAKTETTESGRVYDIDGKKYPSVTTVTGFAKQAFFAEWRKNNPKEMTRVLDRGNKLHQCVEDYLNNKKPSPDDWGPFIWQLFMQMKSELDKIDNVHAQEIALYSDLLHLAGRVDCVGEYDGKLSIIDFKGSTRDKKKEDIENYFQQATAYAIMWQEMFDKKIEQIVIIVSTDDGGVQVFKENPINYVKSLKRCIEDYFKAVLDERAFL